MSIAYMDPTKLSLACFTGTVRLPYRHGNLARHSWVGRLLSGKRSWPHPQSEPHKQKQMGDSQARRWTGAACCQSWSLHGDRHQHRRTDTHRNGAAARVCGVSWRSIAGDARSAHRRQRLQQCSQQPALGNAEGKLCGSISARNASARDAHQHEQAMRGRGASNPRPIPSGRVHEGASSRVRSSSVQRPANHARSHLEASGGVASARGPNGRAAA